MKVKQWWHHLLYADVISLFLTKKCQQKEIDENDWYWRRKASYILNDLRRFNKIFRKVLAYDNIKSHKKPGIHPLSRKCIFGKTTGEGVKLPPPSSPSLFRVKGLNWMIKWNNNMFLYSGDKFIFVINLSNQDLRIVPVGHLLKTKKKRKNLKKQEIQDVFVFIKAN